jgi:hypothetical protein
MRTGSATKGARDYHWAMIEITPDDTPGGQDDGHAFLLLRPHRYTGTISKGFATAFGLWLRWGRFAAVRRSARIRPSLPLWQRVVDPASHSVFAGRAHWRHGLRIPLEEHLLVMAPPGASRP